MTEFVQSIETWPQAIVAVALVIVVFLVFAWFMGMARD